MSNYFQVGGTEPQYRISIFDAFGIPQAQPNDWASLNVSAIENAVGTLLLTLPGYYPASTFKKDGFVVVERGLGTKQPSPIFEQCYRIRKIKRLIRRADGGLEKLWVLSCKDSKVALERRIVDYNAGNSYTSKLASADDMMKAVARENYGSLATDTTRQWLTSLAIAGDSGAAPTMRKSFSRRNVLQVMQEIAQTSLELGTYLSFDVIPIVFPGASIPFQAEFRTFTGWRGADHRFPGGNPPLLIGPEIGNLDNVEYEEDYDDEATRAIVGGQGEEELRAIARVTDQDRVDESPWGLIENFDDARDEGDANYLLDEARAVLKRQRPRIVVSGEALAVPGFLFGEHYGFGDFVTAQIDTKQFDGHLAAVTIEKERDGGEKLGVVIRSEN